VGRKRLGKIRKCSSCGDYGRTRKVRGIEEYLCLKKCFKHYRASRIDHVPISDIERARALYEAMRQLASKPVPFPNYDSMAEHLKKVKSFGEIGRHYKRSRSRIQQICKEFFTAKLPNRLVKLERKEKRIREIRSLLKLAKRKRLFLSSPAIVALKCAVRNFGFNIEVVSLGGSSGRIVSIQGKKCLIYVCNRAYRLNLKTSRMYWQYMLRPQILNSPEFVIFVGADGDKFRFFVIPILKIPIKYFQNGTKQRSMYVPQNGPSVSKAGRIGSISNIYQYENAWHLLLPSFNEKTAPAVQSSSTLVTPAP
jgi:hypothetical protein